MFLVASVHMFVMLSCSKALRPFFVCMYMFRVHTSSLSTKVIGSQVTGMKCILPLVGLSDKMTVTAVFVMTSPLQDMMLLKCLPGGGMGTQRWHAAHKH